MSQRINNKRYNAHRFNNKIARQAGMTFIEVLVTLVIMVTGILGAVAMQATAKKGSFDAMQRSLASSLAQGIVERMRSNDATLLEQYEGYDYGAALGSAVENCTKEVGCTPTNMVTHDLYEWELSLMGADVKNYTDKNVGGLIGANGCIVVNGSDVTVVVTWQGGTETQDARTAIDTGNDAGGNATSGKCGGSDDDTRRQVVIDAFII